MRICSFSYGWGQEEEVKRDGFVIYDCRQLPDPEGLGVGPNGKDPKVKVFVLGSPTARVMWADALDVLDGGHDVAFGCFAGKNRSVAMAESLAEVAKREDITVKVEHRNLHVWG